MSEDLVELGHRLFCDADLSIDGTTACSTCHGQHRGFADSNATHPGVKGTPGRRNVMTLQNVAYFSALTWGDPNLRTLEAQVLVPTLGEAPVEMGMHGQTPELARRLSADACYRRQFATAFPERKGAIDMETVALAISAFERTMVGFDADADRGCPASAQRGQALFAGDRLKCASCHAGGSTPTRTPPIP